MNNRDLLMEIERVLATELAKPKRNQLSANWLAREVINRCENHYRRQVEQNMSKILFDADFALESHTHFLE